MTATMVKALHKEWRLHPPVADLLAGFVGYKPPGLEAPTADPEDSPPAAATRRGDDLNELAVLFSSGKIQLPNTQQTLDPHG